MIPGQGGRLGVASDEVLEQRNGAGCAVMQQEMAKVEVAVSSTHFTEVDDAGVPAPVVEPDVGGIEVAVRQVASGDRPLPLLVDADVLELADIDQPVPAGNEVLMQIQAAGLHRGDWHVMTGLPYLTGMFIHDLD